MIKILGENYSKSLRDENGVPIHIGGEDFIKSVLCLVELFTLQEGFQVKAMGQEDWWEVSELNEKPIDYIIAMLGEIGEGIHSLPFKWWGPNSEDSENFITEIVDALHFELSNTIRVFHKTSKLLNFSRAEKYESLRSLFTRFGGSVSNSFGFNGDRELNDTITQNLRYNLLKNYIADSIMNDRVLWSESTLGVTTYDIFKPLYSLLFLAYSFNVSFAELRERYITKNALNHVRKLNGYKEGTYNKTWISIEKGISAEDNTIALELVRKNSGLNMNEIIILLDNYYKETILASV